ncbi:MAG TPA: DUF1553 domain-containing protein [Planctomycetota bacterium]|nr:DUF1553 domain-containing protein [Planctomycetota bacterium]
MSASRAFNHSEVRSAREAGAVALLLLISLLSLRAQASDEADGIAFFEKRIRPVLVERCYECHSVQAKKSKGGLLLDSRKGLLTGGNTGAAVVPRQLDKGTLLNAIRYKDEDTQMPPKGKLSAEQIADFETWIKMGAPDPREEDAGSGTRQTLTLERAKEFWSFKPVARVAEPAVKDKNWPFTPVDRFVLAKLEQRGLKPVGDASRHALIRRATFDLTGLPPTPAEIDSFINDSAPTPEAFTKVVERLLASPHYGERWGRHWMDLVRYADTAGDNSDYPIPQAYLYRNYIIDSFNADKPYDQFVREQLAGDLMPHSSWDQRNQQVIATGYIAMSRRFGSVVDRYPQNLTIDDTLDNMGKTFLGLGLSCARCHDHKFDPISKEDYFGLYGFFHSTKYPFPGIELLKVQKDFVPLIPAEEVEKLMGPHKAKEAELEAEVKKYQSEMKSTEKEKEKLQAQVAKVPKEEQAAIAERITALERRVNEIRGPMGAATKKLEQHRNAAPKIPNAYAVSDGKPADSNVHLRGEPDKPGELVPRRFLNVLGGKQLPPDVAAASSGRLQLAEWITAKDNPLFTRVMVNRIWQHHFGRGLVSTPNDYGSRGSAPTHPELLDWLAGQFAERGFSIKQMHRLLMLSRVYQLSAAGDARNEVADPENTLLWRRQRTRLDADTLRDTLLAVSGTLDRTPHTEPHPFPPMAKWGFTQHYPFKDTYPTTRRSVYIMTRRLNTLPFFTTFDGADSNATTPRRDSSVTTLQALFWLNDPFFHEQAKAFSARLLKEEADEGRRIQHAYRLAIGREPSSMEQKALADYLPQTRTKLKSSGTPAEQIENKTWESFARAVFRLNEFIYID